MNVAETTALHKVPRVKPARFKGEVAVILVTGEPQRRFAAWENIKTVRYFKEHEAHDNPIAYVPTLNGYKEWSAQK